MESNKNMYESTIIINPMLENQQLEDVVKTTQEFIVKNGGVVKSTDHLGRKRLAYPVNKRNNGYFVQFLIEADGDIVPKLDRIYEYDENIMRYLTIRLDAKTLKIREAQKDKARDIDDDLPIGPKDMTDDSDEANNEGDDDRES